MKLLLRRNGCDQDHAFLAELAHNPRQDPGPPSTIVR